MNINLRAEMQCIINVKGKKQSKKIYESFDCIQTPTDATERILESSDPYKEYCNWLEETFSVFEPTPEYIYADDDWLEENPIDIIYEHNYKKHIRKLDEFLKEHDGWKIVWYGS